MLVASHQITLTAEEDRLCSLLDDFKRHVQETEPESPQVECRIAGGWVRDKVRRLYVVVDRWQGKQGRKEDGG